MNRIHSRRMDTSFFHTKFPTTSRAEGAVSSANTGTLLFTGSSQLQQQQTSNHPRPPRATDDPSRHSTISAASVGGRPGLATVETTARGALHPLRAAAPVTGRYTRSEGVHCLRIGCSTPNHKNKRGICETIADTPPTHRRPAPHAANPHCPSQDRRTGGES